LSCIRPETSTPARSFLMVLVQAHRNRMRNNRATGGHAWLPGENVPHKMPWRLGAPAEMAMACCCRANRREEVIERIGPRRSRVFSPLLPPRLSRVIRPARPCAVRSFGTSTVRCHRRRHDRGPPADRPCSLGLPPVCPSLFSGCDEASPARYTYVLVGKRSSWLRVRHLLVGGPCDGDVISI